MAYNDIKYTLNTLVPTALAALMLLLAACGSEQFDDGRTPGQQPGASGPLITVTATQDTRPQTRLGYVDPNDPAQPIEVTWATGDKFYVGKDWPAFSGGSILSEMTAYFSPFTLKEGGAGSKNAEFTGNTPTGTQNGDQLYAIYGDGAGRIALNEEGTLSFDYTKQRQTANGDKTHLSGVDFMVATTTYKTDKQPVFAFTHLGAMMKFTLTLPTEGLTVKQLTLTTTDGSKPFSDAAQWKKDGALALSNSGDSNSDQLLLFLGEEEGITLTDTKVLTAYMMVAPTTLTKDIAPIAGKDIKLEVTDADGVVYTATLKGADIEQGNYYIVEAELKKPAEEMSFTIKVGSTTDFNIPFPINVTTPADITVDWGDGNVVEVKAGTLLTRNDAFYHSYKAVGTYTITITSAQMDATKKQIPSIDFNYRDLSNITKLISINSPILNTGQTSFTFDSCPFTELPKGMFDKNTQVTSFDGCFEDCTSLTKLPEGLFDKNTKAKNFSGCFENCSKLVLNDKIFGYNASPDRFDGLEMTFRGCFLNTGSDLTPEQQAESVAPRLWEYNVTVDWSSTNCYKGCKAGNLAGIPTEWGTPAE